MEDVPPFDDAVGQFANFLRESGRPAKISWVFSEDVLWRSGGVLSVGWPVRQQNLEAASAYYDTGRKRARGVCLEGFAFAEGETLGSMWFPEDDLDAEFGMISGLKLSVSTQPQLVRLHSRNWLWSIQRRLAKPSKGQTDSLRLPSMSVAAM